MAPYGSIIMPTPSNIPGLSPVPMNEVNHFQASEEPRPFEFATSVDRDTVCAIVHANVPDVYLNISAGDMNSVIMELKEPWRAMLIQTKGYYPRVVVVPGNVVRIRPDVFSYVGSERRNGYMFTAPHVAITDSGRADITHVLRFKDEDELRKILTSIYKPIDASELFNIHHGVTDSSTLRKFQPKDTPNPLAFTSGIDETLVRSIVHARIPAEFTKVYQNGGEVTTEILPEWLTPVLSHAKMPRRVDVTGGLMTKIVPTETKFCWGETRSGYEFTAPNVAAIDKGSWDFYRFQNLEELRTVLEHLFPLLDEADVRKIRASKAESDQAKAEEQRRAERQKAEYAQAIATAVSLRPEMENWARRCFAKLCQDVRDPGANERSRRNAIERCSSEFRAALEKAFGNPPH